MRVGKSKILLVLYLLFASILGLSSVISFSVDQEGISIIEGSINRNENVIEVNETTTIHSISYFICLDCILTLNENLTLVGSSGCPPGRIYVVEENYSFSGRRCAANIVSYLYPKGINELSFFDSIYIDPVNESFIPDYLTFYVKFDSFISPPFQLSLLNLSTYEIDFSFIGFGLAFLLEKLKY